jgi:hypothetical protein
MHSIAQQKKGDISGNFMHANASMTAGLAGQQKCKLEGGQEEHETLNQKKIQLTMSGAYRILEILKEMFNFHQASKGISAEDCKEIKKKLFAKENTYENRQINAKLEIFDERRNTHKAPIQIQRQLLGMDLTPLATGKRQKSELTSKKRMSLKNSVEGWETTLSSGATCP